MYNCEPMKILRFVSFYLGLMFVLTGMVVSIFFESQGPIFWQSLLGIFVGVLIFWFSLERVHPEGYRFFTIFLIFSLGLSYLFLPLGIIGFLVTIFVLWFFRDPDRNPPIVNGEIISPADGVICKIEKVPGPKEISCVGDLLKISVFMNVFDVHVNRAPVAGTIKEMVYIPGKFFNASFDKASENNERNIIIFENEKKEEIVTVQIAGLIARRILAFVNRLDYLNLGERFGLIRFGSRVDIYLPSSYEPTVELGQKVTAGESIIAS